MFRLVCVSVMAAALLLSGTAAMAAPAPAKATVNGSLLVFVPPASVTTPAIPVASKWTHSGCWTPRSGTPCSDIYRDPQGQLWICKACGTTGNPTPGKCRTITQAELDRGLWCS